MSPAAVEAINRGVALAGAMQNTGEGGISDYHRKGGDIIWQIGTGYFGCREADGAFSMERFRESVASAKVRAIEIKLSQGAKPGLGGVLPAAKITPEIARIRGIPLGRDCISPASHSAFNDVSSMLDFIEKLADATGLPVGIKSAVGDLGFWRDRGDAIDKSTRAPDFITIDGGEGGTGAAPARVHRSRGAVAVQARLRGGLSARSPRPASRNRSCSSAPASSDFPSPRCSRSRARLRSRQRRARGDAVDRLHPGAALLYTGHWDIPTGVATCRIKWLMRGLDPTLKAARLANYIVTLRKDLCTWRTRAASRIRRSCRSISSRSSAVPRARCRRAMSIATSPAGACRRRAMPPTARSVTGCVIVSRHASGRPRLGRHGDDRPRSGERADHRDGDDPHRRQSRRDRDRP